MKYLIKIILILSVIIISSNIVFAATIYGNIYDLSLNKISGTRVEVNTTPQQYFISKDGGYSFDIPVGYYIIKARFDENGIISSESKNISVNQEGNYVIDLILFPTFEEEDDISQGPEIIIPEIEEKSFVYLFPLIAILIIGMVIYVIFKGWKFKNKKIEESKKEEKVDKEVIDITNEKDLNQIVDIINEEGGRTTQKHIRKQIPLSEAKISLMIDELEHKGIVRYCRKDKKRKG